MYDGHSGLKNWNKEADEQGQAHSNVRAVRRLNIDGLIEEED